MREITQKKKKDNLYGIIAGILDNITTLHLHCNFPGILQIHHHYH